MWVSVLYFACPSGFQFFFSGEMLLNPVSASISRILSALTFFTFIYVLPKFQIIYLHIYCDFVGPLYQIPVFLIVNVWRFWHGIFIMCSVYVIRVNKKCVKSILNVMNIRFPFDSGVRSRTAPACLTAFVDPLTSCAGPAALKDFLFLYLIFSWKLDLNSWKGLYFPIYFL
jgi:hypothetical protein